VAETEPVCGNCRYFDLLNLNREPVGKIKTLLGIFTLGFCRINCELKLGAILENCPCRQQPRVFEPKICLPTR